MWGRKGGEWPRPFQMEEWLRTLLTPRVTCSKPFKVPHPGRTLSSTNLGAWEVPFCIGGRKPWREGKGTALIPYMTIEVGEEILKLRVCLPPCSTGKVISTIRIWCQHILCLIDACRPVWEHSIEVTSMAFRSQQVGLLPLEDRLFILWPWVSCLTFLCFSPRRELTTHCSWMFEWFSGIVHQKH